MSEPLRPAVRDETRARIDLAIALGVVGGVLLLGLGLGIARSLVENSGRQWTDITPLLARRLSGFGSAVVLAALAGVPLAAALATGRAGQLAALAATSFREVCRGGALWLAGAAALAVVLGAPLMEAEGGAPGRVKMIVTLAMGAALLVGTLLAVALPALSFSREIETRSIFVACSKPVPRWALFCGKLAGIGAALAAAAAMMWAAALAASLLALRAEAARERAAGRPGEGAWLTAYWSRRDERPRLPAAAPGQTPPRAETLGPGQSRSFVLDVRGARTAGGWLVLRVHAVPGDPLISSAPATVRCGGRAYPLVISRSSPADLPVPISAAEDGRMRVELAPALDSEGRCRGLRTDPRGTVVPAGPGSALPATLAKAMALVWMQMMTVAAVTLAAAGVLSFPVAAVTGVTAAVTGHLSGMAVGILRGALRLAGGLAGAEEAEVQAAGRLAHLVRQGAAGLLSLLPDFDAASPGDFIARGAYLPWAFVAAAAFGLLALRVLPVAALGCLVFSRREVGR